MLSPKIIALEEGWNNEIKAKAIDVLEDMLNTGLDKNKPRLFDPKEYVQTYTTCYNMCTQRSPYNWSEQLYQRHGETICDYLSKTVLPALKQKSGNALLTELTVRWSNHKIMNKWMRLFFMYLDRYYVKHHSLPTSAAPRPFLLSLPPRSRARTIVGSTSRGSSTSRRSSTTR